MSKYEKVEGWAHGQPEVLVNKKAINELGMPVVNHDGLHRLFTDAVGLPYDHPPRVNLRGLAWSNRTPAASIHWGSNEMDIDATYCETAGLGTVRIAAHEARHIWDSHSYSRKPEDLYLKGLAVAVLLANFELGGGPRFAVNGAIIAALCVEKSGILIDPFHEERAEAQEVAPIVDEHKTDILFPRSGLTRLYATNGEIPEDMLHVLEQEPTFIGTAPFSLEFVEE